MKGFTYYMLKLASHLATQTGWAVCDGEVCGEGETGQRRRDGGGTRSRNCLNFLTFRPLIIVSCGGGGSAGAGADRPWRNSRPHPTARSNRPRHSPTVTGTPQPSPAPPLPACHPRPHLPTVHGTAPSPPPDRPGTVVRVSVSAQLPLYPSAAVGICRYPPTHRSDMFMREQCL